jgi:LAO/AO transport system kinase
LNPELQNIDELVKGILQQDVRAAARFLRYLDDYPAVAVEGLKKLFSQTGRAHVIGITGSPGVGKSTLTDGLITQLRYQKKTVGVLAVDPTSPFSGGAILGDRIRMQRHSTDSGVFIRSIATRGHFGGLTRSTRGGIMVLDALGKDVIIVETVGVGQDEVDVARMADSTVVVLAPGLGDEIQALKAGILEVADIFVVNKADRDGVDKAISELRAMIELGKNTAQIKRDWTPPIIKCIAVRGEGLKELWANTEEHRQFIEKSQCAYLEQLNLLNHKRELVDLIKQKVIDELLEKLDGTEDFDKYLEEFMTKRTDPYTICERILNKMLN